MPKRVPVELPVPQIQEQTVEVAKAGPQERAQQRMAFFVTVEVPQALFIDRVLDIPVVQQRQTPMQSMGTVVDMPLCCATPWAPGSEGADDTRGATVAVHRLGGSCLGRGTEADAHGLDNPEDCGDSPHRSERAEKVRSTEGGTRRQGGRRPRDHAKNLPLPFRAHIKQSRCHVCSSSTTRWRNPRSCKGRFRPSRTLMIRLTLQPAMKIHVS